ncbi:beta-1,6-N-acetylglucosaminyltransferase [Antarcticibacterium sp. 1MA-6-2]|uniref:beta-1,6-N-acetylglucosaminyltransferase n=1 Tax=Antarcticibacterium sp. 1MA-6-2 TaxID=2908210 RepID=UPI001F25D5C7|nr:beta-1,6-N-acetylglucosaminyltransferase [Antarcticibacterium sp. 1MA-6-2]UJH92514.1 beta-1,6-N-acetylglucosaminyltransferase [Antarcticibacterium sp. 1MA-6-2]
MDIHYIILAHQYPLQLRRLINIIRTPETYFYIHIDRRVKIEPFYQQLKNCENVVFIKDENREKGTWGDIGIVKATLNAMETIVKNHTEGFCYLLSGQDYPLQPTSSISDYLTKNPNTNFIDLSPVPKLWNRQGLDRIYKYKINKTTKRGHFLLLPSIYDKDFYQRSTLGKLNYLRKSKRLRESTVIFRKRQFPQDLKPFGGSVYWAFPVNTLKKILNYVKDNPEYLKYHKYTLCADEIFFHSIIMHLKLLYNLEISPSLTYVNWERSSGPLPVTFDVADFEELKVASHNFLFARKFDLTKDDAIFERCDKELLHLE